MFNLREYIKKGFIDAVGEMADYQIILNSVAYQEKGVLTEEDLSEINQAIEKQYEVEEKENVEEKDNGISSYNNSSIDNSNNNDC